MRCNLQAVDCASNMFEGLCYGPAFPPARAACFRIGAFLLVDFREIQRNPVNSLQPQKAPWLVTNMGPISQTASTQSPYRFLLVHLVVVLTLKLIHAPDLQVWVSGNSSKHGEAQGSMQPDVSDVYKRILCTRAAIDSGVLSRRKINTE